MLFEGPKHRHTKLTIYRGTGGGGNATTDTEVALLTQLEQSAVAAAAAAEAAQSAALLAATEAAESASSIEGDVASAEAARIAAEAAQEAAEEAQDAAVTAQGLAEDARDAALAAEAALENVYTKDEADDLLDLKADQATTYTKTETDTTLALKLNAANPSYTGTLTGGTGVVNLGSGQLYKDASGNVGIGTSSPTSLLQPQVNSAGNTPNLLSLVNNTGGAVVDTGVTLWMSGRGAQADSDRGVFIRAVVEDTSNSHSLRFGTSSPSAAPTERARIDSSGNLLIGYTSSNGNFRLQVNSQIFATSSTIATSDGRYKEDVTPLNGALDLVTALNPVQFKWKEHPVHNFVTDAPTIGFIAQEVEEVLKDTPYINSIIKANECILAPEVKDENGEVTQEAVTEEFLGIAEGNLIALLTKAIQEQQAIITALTARVEALEGTQP
jgi:hypothetical protein